MSLVPLKGKYIEFNNLEIKYMTLNVLLLLVIIILKYNLL